MKGKLEITYDFLIAGTSDKKEASSLLVFVSSMIDKLVKKNIIHKNKASNLKSKLTKKVNAL